MDFTQCPLFQLKSKKQLMILLGLDRNFLKLDYVASQVSAYIKKDGKERLIEPPSNELKKIQTKMKKMLGKPFEYSDVVKYALEIHKRAGNVNDIEFLITYHDDNRFQIDCVKDGEAIIDCKTAWIGSPEAHEAFQRYRSMCNPGTERASRYTISAFADVVAGCKDTSVGGFPIRVHYSNEKNAFCYSNHYAIIDSKTQLVKAGETIKFHMSARDGGYSYEVISDSLFGVLISIDQLDHMILYSRNLRSATISANDPCLFGLMLPMRVITNDNGELVNIG